MPHEEACHMSEARFFKANLDGPAPERLPEAKDPETLDADNEDVAGEEDTQGKEQNKTQPTRRNAAQAGRGEIGRGSQQALEGFCYHVLSHSKLMTSVSVSGCTGRCMQCLTSVPIVR